MRALISVADKTNILSFASGLHKHNIKLISTGGTYDLLKSNKIPVTNVLNITSFNNTIDSIIKTLYPEIYAGIDADRNNCVQMAQLRNLNIETIDFVIVNLFNIDSVYNCENFLEYIDIGGPTMLRSAAKNYKDVVVVADPNDYNIIINELDLYNNISIETRKYLMKKVFKITSEYDKKIKYYINKLYP